MKDGVLVLTTSVPEENSILASTNLEPKKSTMTLPVWLNHLSSAFFDKKEKLKVELEDILNDSFVCYKDPSFDPRKKLQIQIKGQPVAETGSVARQYFPMPMEGICDKFFEGVLISFQYIILILLPGVLWNVLEKMVVHSILHAGLGIPIFTAKQHIRILWPVAVRQQPRELQ